MFQLHYLDTHWWFLDLKIDFSLVIVYLWSLQNDISCKNVFDSSKPLTWYIKPTEHLNGLSPNLRCYNQCKFPNINYISFELLAKFLLVNLLLSIQSILNPHICQKEPFQVISDFIDFSPFFFASFLCLTSPVGCAFILKKQSNNLHKPLDQQLLT